jgi:hypothetical protein
MLQGDDAYVRKPICATAATAISFPACRDHMSKQLPTELYGYSMLHRVSGHGPSKMEGRSGLLGEVEQW